MMRAGNGWRAGSILAGPRSNHLPALKQQHCGGCNNGAQSVIDIVSDVICPWCFLGKRRLDKALASLPDIKADIGWRPFMLDPTVPLEGMDRRTYLANKFGEERLADAA